MDRGYVKLWRKVEDSRSWSRSSLHRALMITLLVRSNWKDSYFRGERVSRGQLATSVRSIAEELGEPQTSVFRAMKDLVEDGFITIENVERRWSRITVVNWDTYQCNSNAPWNTDESQTEHNRNDSESQSEQSKELKNERIEESINNPHTPLPEDSPFPLTPAEPTPSKRKAKTEKKSAAGKVEYSAEFEELWHIYPNKSNKKGAYKAYLSALENGELPEHTDLIRRVKNRRFEPDWEKEGGRFVPHLQTWLNRSGWEDGGCFDTESRPQKVMPQRLVEAKKEIDEYFQHMVDTSNCKEEADVWKDMWEMNLEVEGCAPWQWSN